MKTEKAILAREKYEKEAFKRPNTIGVAVGNRIKGGRDTGEPCVSVLLERKVSPSTLSPMELHPKTIDIGGEKVKIDCIEVGKIRALNTNMDNQGSVDRKGKHRPLFPGISIANRKITAGTIGFIVKCLDDDSICVLSNAHVLCESPFRGISEAMGAKTVESRGEDIISLEKSVAPYQARDIYQPGPHDGGTSNDKVANLKKMVLMSLKNPNYGDRAIGELLPDIEYSTSIAEIGKPAGVRVPEVGMRLRKSGRTTGLTVGEITHIIATVNVSYNEGTAQVRECIIATTKSSGGDSGSPAVDDDN